MPQTQALSMMAGKKVMYGTAVPRMGLSRNRRNKATIAQRTAKEYRAGILGRRRSNRDLFISYRPSAVVVAGVHSSVI
jgi:hypothetical protein